MLFGLREFVRIFRSDKLPAVIDWLSIGILVSVSYKDGMVREISNVVGARGLHRLPC